jgi:hypothetical protein
LVVISFLIEDQASELLAAGALVRLLRDWCEPFDGRYLCYPDAVDATIIQKFDREFAYRYFQCRSRLL